MYSLIAILRHLLCSSTVDDCLADLGRLKRRLVSTQQRHIKLVVLKHEFIGKLEGEIETHEDEVNRAYRIIGKIDQFVE